MPNSFIRSLLALGAIHTTGCNYSDEVEELSGGYFYRNEGEHTKDILSHSPNGENIYSQVTAYDFNSDFIIATQKPIYAEYKSAIAFELQNNSNAKDDLIHRENAADSIIKHNSFYQSIFLHQTNYWIISHKDNRVHGPLTKQQYTKLRNTLHVPEELQIGGK